MFRKKKAAPQSIEYDRNLETPAIKCSICNGEQVAGFLNKKTGKFRESVCIHNARELEEFKAGCSVTDVKKIY